MFRISDNDQLQIQAIRGERGGNTALYPSPWVHHGSDPRTLRTRYKGASTVYPFDLQGCKYVKTRHIPLLFL